MSELIGETLYSLSHETVARFWGPRHNLEIKGRENLPQKGPLIVVVNHPPKAALSQYLALFATFPWRLTILGVPYKNYVLPGRLTFSVADRLKACRFLELKTSSTNLAVLKTTLDDLKKDRVVVIAPEGRVSPTDEMQKGNPGAVWLAVKSGAPVLPVAVFENKDKKPLIKVNIGELITIPPLPKEANRDQWYQEQTNRVMQAIAKLMPSERRGDYSL